LSLLHLGLFVALIVAASVGAVIALAIAGDNGSDSSTAVADATSTLDLTPTTSPSPSVTPSPSAVPTATTEPCTATKAAADVRHSVVRVQATFQAGTGVVIDDEGTVL